MLQRVHYMLSRHACSTVAARYSPQQRTCHASPGRSRS